MESAYVDPPEVHLEASSDLGGRLHLVPWAGLSPDGTAKQKTPLAAFTTSEAVLRCANALIAGLTLLLISPILLIIAVAVKLTSRGPVFYTQPRVGLDRRRPDAPSGNWRRQIDYGGRVFRIYKFRTMYVGADRAGQVWARPNDPRITPVGRILRLYRLDELPQLINVLKGDMNLVGPRPEQPTIFMQLREKIDGYPRRQRVLPGITGWAQVNQQYDRSVEDVKSKLRLDLEYIERRSLGQDLRILLQTVPVVLLRKGSW